jgi:uncharacterized protein YndB with AHSA1/START domain
MKTVGHLTIEPVGDRGIRSVRRFNAPRRLVWEAHTRPELLQRWMLGPPGWEMPVCEIDLRPGGRFRYLWRNHDGSEMGQVGSFREIDPPARIVHTEKFEGDDTPGDGAVITTTFEEAGGKTTLTMMMLFPTPEVREQALGVGMETGMEAGYERLDAILASQAA